MEPSQRPDFDAALSAWRETLGEAAVLTGSRMGVLARTTLPRGHIPGCVLRPTHTDAVQALIRIAAAHRVPLHPVSRGRNWGYGDALPAAEGTVLVDLSGMDRVLEINATHGYAVIEAGVSQQQLYDAVQREAPGYWIDATGAGPDASVLGNALDRGFGHTPYSDHLRSLLGLEVVLADGSLLRTGFDHFDNARAARVFPYGIGPVLDGLFSQGSYGIATRATVALQPAPRDFRFFWIRVDDPATLAPLVDALRPLRIDGTLNSAVHIGNDLRIISTQRRYPWDVGGPPLPPGVIERLRRESGVGAWNASGSLAGSRAQVREGARALQRAVGKLGRVVFMTDRKMAIAQRLAGWLGGLGLAPTLRRQVEALAPNYGLLKGVPTRAPLAGMHWRTRTPCDTEADLRDTTCGLLWLSPVMPIEGAAAVDVQTLASPILARHGFDFMVTYTMLNERALVAVINISFDRETAGEPEAAYACYDELFSLLAANGFYPYRATPRGMQLLHREADPYWETTRRIKHALDPGNIISPGRYVP